MFSSYTLYEINAEDCHKVEKEVLETLREVFPDADSELIAQLFADVRNMFAGKYDEFQASDTIYHDLAHTLQATLCWIRVITNRHLQNIDPVLQVTDIENGLHGILLHDIGFLKNKNDTKGTGGKFTFVHKQRSCELAAIYLTQKNWSTYDNYAVQHYISCTGPRSIIDAVPFNNHSERLIGESICTADYLGQMSDPNYLKKLYPLFSEFEESDNYRNIPKDNRMFKSPEELILSTPDFWENSIIHKLEEECHGLYKFLAQPFPDGVNAYMQNVEDNIDIIRKEFENPDNREKYFGTISLNANGS